MSTLPPPTKRCASQTTAHEIFAAACRACVAAIDNVEIATADDRNASQNSTPLKLRRRIQSLEAKLGETKIPSSSSCADSSNAEGDGKMSNKTPGTAVAHSNVIPNKNKTWQRTTTTPTWQRTTTTPTPTKKPWGNNTGNGKKPGI